MNTNSQIENFEKAFYHDGYQLGMKAVEAQMDENVLNNSIKLMYSSIDNLTESLTGFATQHGQPIDCKMGCEWCCHQPVFALDYELKFLKDYIFAYFDNDTILEIKEKSKQKQQLFSELKKDELLNAKYPCPLLNEGACIAYEARPVACRIYLSSNVGSCLHFYNKPTDKNSYPALLDMPMRLGRMMNEGFKAALKTNGLVSKEYRIEERIV